MNPEQLESQLNQSTRKPVLSQDQSRRIWNKVELPQPVAKHHRWTWFILPIVPVVVLAGIMIRMAIQPEAVTTQTVVQQANTTAIAADPVLRWADIAARGGAGEEDPSAIQWTLANALPEQRETIRGYLVDTFEPYVATTGDVTSCQEAYYMQSEARCVELAADGRTLIWSGSIQEQIDEAKRYISDLVDLPENQFSLIELDPDEESPGITEYYLYTNPKSPVEDVPQIDLGWTIAVRDGVVVGLRGVQLPNVDTITDSFEITLRSPEDAFAVLQEGIPNSDQLAFSQSQLYALLRANPNPAIEIDRFELAYVLAQDDVGLAYIPVYYVHGSDLVTGKSVAIFIDPSIESTLFNTYRPIITQ